jgi:hypothetical protein
VDRSRREPGVFNNSWQIGRGEFLNLFYPVAEGNADSPYLAVYQHLAGPAFTDPAGQASITALNNAVTVNRKTSLVQGCGHSGTLPAGYLPAGKGEGRGLRGFYAEDGMLADPVHINMIESKSSLARYLCPGIISKPFFLSCELTSQMNFC